jgi:tetratricopeptide (TPR) repeat protein
MTHFARALGAAHLGDRAAARAAIDSLQQIRDRLTAATEVYWAGQVEIERRGAAAWLARAEGRTAEALAEMRGAAGMEDATEKNAVTPGPIAPARELLGEMLLAAGQPGQALQEFEATLQKEPNRYRALAGAARAAAQSGDRLAAAKLYGRLLTVCERADSPGRPELVEARRFTAPAATAP